MRNIALVGLFAAAVAAQEAKDPEIELAHIIAVEEQEHDLDQAQRLYRAATQDPKISSRARKVAYSRLYGLLRRLGKFEEAMQLVEEASAKGVAVSVDDVTGNQQGAEREQELRLQARELLKKAGDTRTLRGRTELQGIPGDIADQLLWIGRPAVPEVVAFLQQSMNDSSGRASLRSRGLVSYLWRVGGPQASKFLIECASHDTMAGIAAENAVAMLEVDVDAPEVRAYLENEDWRITRQFLDVGKGNRLVDRIDPAQLLVIAERGSVPMRAFMLRTLAARELTAEQLARVHQLVRAGLAGTDADYGNAAQLFLASTTSQQSTEGLLLLLQRFPELHEKRVPIAPRAPHSSRGMPAGVSTTHIRGGSGVAWSRGLDPESVSVLVPAIDAVIEAIGPVSPTSRRSIFWLRDLMFGVVEVGGEAVMPRALSWWDSGYEMWPVLQGKVTTQNAAQVLHRLDRVPVDNVQMFLGYFERVELPRDMFTALRDRANAEENSETRLRLGSLMVATGHEQAAEWVVAEWRKDSDCTRWATRALVSLGRRNTSEELRAAMGSMIRSFGGKPISVEQRSQLLLAMLSMSDERALDFVAVGLAPKSTVHPYAPADNHVQMTPLQYLIYANPQPPHGYSEAQILDTVARLLNGSQSTKSFRPRVMSVDAIPDPVLLLFAVEDRSNHDGWTWQGTALARLRLRIASKGDVSVLEPWFLSVLGNPDYPTRFFSNFAEEIGDSYRDRIAAVVVGDDEDWAYQAVTGLRRLGTEIDFEQALKSRHARIRTWAADQVRLGEAEASPAAVMPLLADESRFARLVAAQHLGAIVHKQAVPGLISLLKDSDEDVRKAAADALTRIRFYHEQQAHWDRVLKGLDASPASAAEKLLLQAKPGQPKAQRLLAITSLGVLGAPEALPFLIEWTQDADEDVAKTAKAAITKIHLDPRK